MRCSCATIGLLLSLALPISVNGPSRLEASPTDDVLNVVPPDMAACLIVEDLSGHYQRFVNSTLYQRIEQMSVVRKWRQSREYAKLMQARSVLPLYFGLSLAELRDGIFGQSVVLAFRPGPQLGKDDVGILLCHARDGELLGRLFKTLTSPVGGRTVETRAYRDVTYVQRTEANGNRDYLVQLGAIGALTKDESALKAVIDASVEENGFGSLSISKSMRESLPKEALFRLLLRTRPFDEHLSRSLKGNNPVETLITKLVVERWKRLPWLALTLQVGHNVHFGFHLGPEEPAADQDTLNVAHEKSEFWSRAPAEALVAASVRCDFTEVGRMIRAAVDAQPDAEIHNVLSIFQQLFAGHDLQEDVLPNLGPEVNLLVTASAQQLAPNLLTVLRFRDAAPGQLVAFPLSLALETALHPVLVVIGVEHNKTHDDTIKVRVQNIEGTRVHSLSGSRRLPSWAEPGFAIFRDHFLAGSSPGAIIEWTRRLKSEPEAGSTVASYLAGRVPQNFAPLLYVNVTAIRELLTRHRETFLVRAGGPGNADAIDKLDAITELVATLDRIVLGRHTDPAGVRHWTLSLFAAEAHISEPAAGR